MSTLDLPIRTTARTTAIAGRVVLSGLRTFSGLAVILGAVLFVILNDVDARGASDSLPADPQQRLIVVTHGRPAVASELVFYLVETQPQADLVAREDYENWAAGNGGGLDRAIHILFARDAGEEAAAYQLILQEVRDARQPPVVSIFDWRLVGD